MSVYLQVTYRLLPVYLQVTPSHLLTFTVYTLTLYISLLFSSLQFSLYQSARFYNQSHPQITIHSNMNGFGTPETESGSGKKTRRLDSLYSNGNGSSFGKHSDVIDLTGEDDDRDGLQGEKQDLQQHLQQDPQNDLQHDPQHDPQHNLQNDLQNDLDSIIESKNFGNLINQDFFQQSQHNQHNQQEDITENKESTGTGTNTVTDIDTKPPNDEDDVVIIEPNDSRLKPELKPELRQSKPKTQLLMEAHNLKYHIDDLKTQRATASEGLKERQLQLSLNDPTHDFEQLHRSLSYYQKRYTDLTEEIRLYVNKYNSVISEYRTGLNYSDAEWNEKRRKRKLKLIKMDKERTMVDELRKQGETELFKIWDQVVRFPPHERLERREMLKANWFQNYITKVMTLFSNLNKSGVEEEIHRWTNFANDQLLLTNLPQGYRVENGIMIDTEDKINTDHFLPPNLLNQSSFWGQHANFTDRDNEQYRFQPIYGQNQQEDAGILDLLDNIVHDEEDQDDEKLPRTPNELSISLLKHQRMGLEWLLRMEDSKSKGGILADDMGLGKTIQAIALVLAHRPPANEPKTTLIVAPVSLVRQWAGEFEAKIKPSFQLKVGLFHGGTKSKFKTFNNIADYDIVLTSYGTLSSEWKKHFGHVLEKANVTKGQDVLPDVGTGGEYYRSPFFEKDAMFYRIILDEAQNIKNKLSLASKSVSCLRASYRFCLTGTPMQNNVYELYPIIRFLQIKPYNKDLHFRQQLSQPIAVKGGTYRAEAMRKLRALLKAILLRRSKDSKIDGKPILELPEKRILIEETSMDEEEKDRYAGIEAGIQKTAKRILTRKVNFSSILVLLLRLRQACCHFFLCELGSVEEDYRSKHWKNLRRAINNLTEGDFARILRVLEDEAEVETGTEKKIEEVGNSEEEEIITCPVCMTTIPNESIIEFPCSHKICEECIEEYFETNQMDENEQWARCRVCQHKVSQSQLIDYKLFHMMHIDKMDDSRLSNYFGPSPNNGKLSNQQKIRRLVAKYDGFEPSAKMEKAMEIMLSIWETNPDDKIIMFSQFSSHFDLLKLVLANQKIPFLRYDGSMSIEQKDHSVREFYQSDTKLMLISLKAGNVGLTLTCASRVIIMDPFWNPFVEEQAMDRVHRIGQTKEVHVYRILVKDTVEQRIVKLQNQKKEVIQAALDEDGMKSISRLDRRELGFLFGLNALEAPK